jgi:hypothetical protein
MFRTFLATASVIAILATGAPAQTQTQTAPADTPRTTAPAPTTRPAAPARTTAADTGVYLSANEITTGKIVGISIYAPKPEGAAATRSSDPVTTGSTPGATAPSTTATTPGATAPTTPTPGATAPAAPGAAMAPAGTAGMTFTPTPVSDEQWRAMRDRHDSIGKVDDLVLGADGRLSHAIIGVGGFLGIGEKKVALEWSEVKLMRSSDGTLFGVIVRTKQQLQEMPRFMGERT